MPETFTQEELDAAVKTATGPLQQRLAELEAQVQETEVGRSIAEATAAKDAEISALQEQLDAATAARTAAETKLSETEQYWSEAIAAAEEAATVAARRIERVDAAKAAGVFDDAYLEANADRFAAMSDEDFAARLDEWRLIASKSRDTDTRKPATTALTATATQPTKSDPTVSLSVISELRKARIDPRTLAGGAR